MCPRAEMTGFGESAGEHLGEHAVVGEVALVHLRVALHPRREHRVVGLEDVERRHQRL